MSEKISNLTIKNNELQNDVIKLDLKFQSDVKDLKEQNNKLLSIICDLQTQIDQLKTNA